jgi:hypothetical protein
VVKFDRLVSPGPWEVHERTLSGTGTDRENGEEFRYLVRRLVQAEVPRIHRLHREILRTLPSPLLLYDRDPEFFAECIGGRGCVVGAFSEDRLIGYATGWVPGADHEGNFGRDLGLEAEDLRRVAHLAGSSVLPPYRGNRLHTDLVIMRSAVLHAEGYHHQCGEIVPMNVYSIRSYLANGHFLKGFRIDDFRFDPEGEPHFILHRDTRSSPRRIDEPDPPEAPIHDVKAYLRMLGAGRWGFRVRDAEGEARLCYGLFER